MSLTVCFTGHRPKKLGGYVEPNPIMAWVCEQLYNAIVKAEGNGTRTFISGGALGVDQWAAKIIIDRRMAHRLDTRLIIARPFPSQASKWPKQSVRYYEYLCSHADEVVDVSPDPYSPAKMMLRNKWMVDHSNGVIGVWTGAGGGTKDCVDYTLKQGKPFYHINPDSRQVKIIRGVG